MGGCARLAREEAPAAPISVTLTYLGVAGWRLEHGEHVLLVDPYFSRVDAEKGGPLVPKGELIAKYLPARADAVLVGHSHYDHLLDAPEIAKRTGAVLVGTNSTVNVGRAAGLDESQMIAIPETGGTFPIGPWAVRAVRGLHSLIGKLSLPIPRKIKLPMTAEGYAEGGVLDYEVTIEGRSVLFIGSANFIEPELQGLRPDVAVIATGVREKVPDYTCRLLRVLDRPPLVIANHFDAHWQPLGPKQMDIGDEALADLARFKEEVRACAPGTKIIVPVHFRPMTI